MLVEDKLRELIIDRYGTVKNFSEKNNLKYSTVTTILTRGVLNANVKNVIEVCRALDISVDALAKGQIVPKNINFITLDQMLIMLETRAIVNNNGKHLLAYQSKLLETAVEVARESK